MRYVVVLALLIGLWTSGSASADDFVADDVSTVSISAPGGHFSRKLWNITSTGPNALRARVTFSKLQDDPTWLPLLSFSLKNGKSFLSFAVIHDRYSGTLTALFRRVHESTDEVPERFSFTPREGEPFTLRMEWTASGKLIASVGRDDNMERREAEFGLTPQELQILVSGGTLDVAPLELGRVEAITASHAPVPGAVAAAVAPPSEPCLPGSVGLCRSR